jgi:ADP-ribosylglycohydrolase
VSNRTAIVGAILGTAIGDAIGLPYEGLTQRRGVRLLGEPNRHRFYRGRGLVSDDTEHTCIVAQALIASGGEVEVFARQLAWRLRWWLMTVPAGIGLATLKATLKLWLGFSPNRSGVFSAGNGPAMRSAVIGAAVDGLETLRSLVTAATRITHTDARAEHGALTVAYAAWLAKRASPVDGKQFVSQLRSMLSKDTGEELLTAIERAVLSAERGESTEAYAASLRLERGVTGYVNHTVPVAIHAWLRNQRDIRRGIVDVIRCGGDTDTTAAIVGGIIGSAVGKAGIPADWLKGLADWPRTVRWMEELGDHVDGAMSIGRPGRPPRLPVLGLLARNAFFLVVVLLHGFRRGLPPY